MPKNTEIERKYLIKTLPDGLDNFDHDDIEQFYLSFSPVVRMRRRGNIFYLTEKGGGLLVRREVESTITEDEYLSGKEKHLGNIISKTRYLIPLPNGFTAELDIYHGILSGLATVEVEFDSLDAANSFTPPSWFGEDVTESGLYSNSRLARMDIE